MIDIDLSGLRAAVAQIKREVAQLVDFTPLWPVVGPLLVQWQQENIERGTDVDGITFAALSIHRIAKRTDASLRPNRATIGRKAHPFGERPLLDTTALYAHMRWQSLGPDSVSGGATALSLDGTNYPELQNRGFEVNGHRVPARRWSGLRADNQVTLAALLERHSRGALGGGGG